MSGEKERLDVLMVQRGLSTSRTKSQALVLAGDVLVDGQAAQKPGMKVSTKAVIELAESPQFVSRGGIKLAMALEHFEINTRGCTCADVGACTGGFTDVLLQRGASRVYAIDVGYGQLDWNLRNDQRVVVMERTNARHLKTLPEAIDLVCVDVSFISLKLILPNTAQWLDREGVILALIKPQFEAGPDKVGKGGVIRDPQVHKEVLKDIVNWSVANNFYPVGLVPSQITGAAGNREFFLWLSLVGDRTINVERAIADCLS